MKVVTARPRRSAQRRDVAVGVVTVLFVLLAVVSISAGLVFLTPAQGRAATVLQDQPGALPWNGRSPLTALLIGTGSGTGASGDSLIVAQYLPGRDSLALLAIPGNLWVSIPGFTSAPISQAYADGGARLTLIAVQSVLKIPIPYYATIDPATARGLVDAIGPLTVRDPVTGSRLLRTPLDGQQTLRYTNIRPVDDGANRLSRELQVLLASRLPLFAPANLPQFSTLLSRFGSGISTNIPYSSLPALASHLGKLRSSQIRVAALDLANGSATRFSSDGQAMLLPDPAGAPALSHNLLTAPHLRAPGGFAVLNGSGVPGQAFALAGWLQQAGIPVGATGSANNFNYGRTEVVVSRRASAADLQTAFAAATLLQIPAVRGHVPGQSSAVSIVIGSDYADPTRH